MRSPRRAKVRRESRIIYDLMPVWLRRLLDLDSATLPTERWTWRHVCRYGRDPAKLADDIERAMRPGGSPTR